jgi:branched-chain amino acid transport system ATP-binding protein
MSGLLELHDLTVSRGAGDILREVSLTARLGELTVLLGPNGAGKSTLLDAVSGVLRPRRGQILLDGVDVTRTTRVGRARRGLRHVEQGRTVFGDLTVRENLAVAARTGRPRSAPELFPELEPRLDTRAALLSGGEQQMLVIARALLREPSLLLLDELSLGLAPVVVARLLPVVRTLADRGMAVLLVEQFAHLVLPLADAAYVLDRGAITYAGPPARLLASPELLHEAYLGG